MTLARRSDDVPGSCLIRASAYALTLATAVSPAMAAEAPVGSAAPTGKIIPAQDLRGLSRDNASPLSITSNLPSTPVRLSVYRKSDRSDAEAIDCVTPCRLLIPKRYGFTLTVDVPRGQQLASDPTDFGWSQPWWCKGGVLCKTELEPRELALRIEPEP